MSVDIDTLNATRMRILLRTDEFPEGIPLLTIANGVHVVPRELEMVSVDGDPRRFAVIEQGVWHHYSGSAKAASVTVVVEEIPYGIEEIQDASKSKED